MITFLIFSFLINSANIQKHEEGYIVYDLKEGNGIITNSYILFSNTTFYFHGDTVKEEMRREIPTYRNGEQIEGVNETSIRMSYPSNQNFIWEESSEIYDTTSSLPKTIHKMKFSLPQIAKITFTTETKVIQGFVCKKAIIEHKISDIKGQNSAIAHRKRNMKKLSQFGIKDDIELLPIPYKTELFYTEALPAHASPFQYANIKGCILEYTHVDGLHILASYISTSPNPPHLFRLPAGITVVDLDQERNKQKKKN